MVDEVLSVGLCMDDGIHYFSIQTGVKPELFSLVPCSCKTKTVPGDTTYENPHHEEYSSSDF